MLSRQAVEGLILAANLSTLPEFDSASRQLVAPHSYPQTGPHLSSAGKSRIGNEAQAFRAPANASCILFIFSRTYPRLTDLSIVLLKAKRFRAGGAIL
jgi:hypothetical protein